MDCHYSISQPPALSIFQAEQSALALLQPSNAWWTVSVNQMQAFRSFHLQIQTIRTCQIVVFFKILARSETAKPIFPPWTPRREFKHGTVEGGIRVHHLTQQSSSCQLTTNSSPKTIQGLKYSKQASSQSKPIAHQPKKEIFTSANL